MTRILKQEQLMSPPTTTPTDLSYAPLRVRALKSIGLMDYRMALLRFIAVENSVIFAAFVWMLLVPESSMGVLTPLQAVTHIDRQTLVALFAAWFFVDMAQSLRGVKPKYAALTTLSGQGLLAGVAVWGVLIGQLSLTALFSHGGVFVLSFIGSMVVIQHERPTATPARFKLLMMPTLSLLMFLLMLGLITRPDAAIARFIEGRYGATFFVCLVGAIAWGSGQLRHDHLTPTQMMRHMTGVYLYALMTVALINSDNTVSLLGVCMTIMVSILSLFFAAIQAQSYSTETAG